MNRPGINRRQFARQLAGGIGGALFTPVLGAAAATASAVRPPRRPNIVLIHSDQHAYRYCGLMGHPVVRTPNLDRIAAEGVVFENTYCGNPVCAPSRAGMLSGVYPSDVGSFCNSTAWDGSIPAWPALLRDAGYRTFGAGKMDANDAFDIGFEETYAVKNGHAQNPDITAFFRRPLCARPAERLQVDGAARSDRHKDGRLAEAAGEFIRRQAGRKQPWAAYVGFHMPHPSFVGWRKYYESYLDRVDLPNLPPGHLESLHFVFQELRNFKNIALPIPEERVRRARAAYYAMITEVDDYVGDIRRALEESGQADNTVLVYCSDHGESLGEHGLWLKNNLFDVAARVPLVMAGPGLPRGARVDTPVAHVDLIRTFLEWGEAALHPKLRGHSVEPLMQGRLGDHPGWAYSESHSEGNCTGSFMIRKGAWKYIEFVRFDGLLFNLLEDPGEFRNRIDDPAAADVRRELHDILHAQVDTVAVTERAFRLQRERMDRLAEGRTEDQMLDEFRDRLGEGQAVNLLTAYYGHTFDYTHKTGGEDAG